MLGVDWKFAVVHHGAPTLWWAPDGPGTWIRGVFRRGWRGGRTGTRSDAELGRHFAGRNGVGESLVVELVLIRISRREAGDRPVE